MMCPSLLSNPLVGEDHYLSRYFVVKRTAE